MGSGERFWWSRLRWRLRGATQWPAFVVLTLVDGVVLHLLPPVSTIGLNLIEGVLLATFGNLFLLGAAAPFLAKRLGRRREAALAAAAASRGATAPPAEAEREVLRDRVATALLAAGLLACLAAGLGNRPVIVSETEATEEVGRTVREFVTHARSEELRRNLEAADTIRLSEGYFRTCIPRDDRGRFLCLFVDTGKEPTQIRRDPSAEPNSAIAGP